jgi:adenosylcobinamide-GDP ribazoletransferase
VHRRDSPAAAVTGAGRRPGNAAPPPPAAGGPAWRVALSLFTVIPAGVGGDLDEGAAARAVFWLPVLGAGLGLAASAVLVFVAAGELSPQRQLLGAALAVGLLAVATGGLHLDGLADTADGLGSRRPADQALEVMRRSDTGPLGVATLVLVLLVQVSALAALPHGWTGAGWAGAGGTGGGWTGAGWTGASGLVLAAVTSRVAVVAATGSPPARPSGFGALVAGRTSATGRAASVVILLGAVVAAGVALGGVAAAARGAAATVAGLAVAALLRWAARRRLGGMTGDVFGAIIELSTATVLVVLVLAS